MTQSIVILLALTVFIAVSIKRSQVAKDRKVVSARITEERKEMGDYSPTQALFREAGVMVDTNASNLGMAGFDDTPASSPSVAASTTPSSAPTPFPATPSPFGAIPTPPHPDLQPPAGLLQLSDFDATTFITEAPSSVVRAGLETEFERIGLQTRWVEPTVAETLRGSERGRVTIYPQPSTAVDADGNLLFPAAGADHVVVRMLAV